MSRVRATFQAKFFLTALSAAVIALAVAGASGVAWRPEEPGGDGWSQDFLDSRSDSIAGGTDDIQRNNVSERVLGLPREPSFDRDIPFNQVPHN